MPDKNSQANTPSNSPHESAQSHFDGANALYLEQQYARYQNGDATLDAGWQRYFASLNDDAAPHRPSWQREDWPPKINGDMTAVLDGNWPETALDDMPAPQKLAEKIERQHILETCYA